MNEWEEILQKVSAKINREAALHDILLLIGIRESCHPARPNMSESEIENLVQMAEQTVLVAARYYQLLWVEDNGWPHYQPVQHMQRMTKEEKELFLQPWILEYVKKNRMFL